MSDPLSLSEEFAASACAYGKGEGVNLTALLTRYAVLQRHQLTDENEKDSIAATLFDCGMKKVETLLARAPGATRFYDDLTDELAKIFSRLLLPESVNHIPARAPARLAQITLDLLRVADAAVEGNFLDSQNRPNYIAYCEYKEKMPSLAAFMLTLADSFTTAVSNSTANVTTNTPVVASKPIVLTRTQSSQNPAQ